MTAKMSRERFDGGLRRATMSPVFCAVANNPSSAPVRRDVPSIYGVAANPHGHGHNYMLEVTLEGEPERATGMIFDLKALKEILNEEIVEPMDHRFLNHEVPPFDRIVPTAENIARETVCPAKCN